MRTRIFNWFSIDHTAPLKSMNRIFIPLYLTSIREGVEIAKQYRKYLCISWDVFGREFDGIWNPLDCLTSLVFLHPGDCSLNYLRCTQLYPMSPHQLYLHTCCNIKKTTANIEYEKKQRQLLVEDNEDMLYMLIWQLYHWRWWQRLLCKINIILYYGWWG